MVATDIKLGPIIAPLEKDDKRTIHFTDLGIDIRTATGLTIKVPINNSACTLPLSAMKSHQNGTDFISHWKAVRGEAQPEDGVSSLSKSFDEDTDYPLELCVSSIGNMGAKPPCKPLKTIQEPEKNDALWLLKGYIDLRLPEGGDFWTGNKESFPQGTDDVVGFIDFLKLPENCQHPYARWWFDLLVVRKRAQRNWSNWLSSLRSATRRHENAPLSATPRGAYHKKCAVFTPGPKKQGSEWLLALVWALGCLQKRVKLHAGQHTQRPVSWYTMVIFLVCD
ncbi:hypothetical protein FGADI_12196 [Fusarium gaditjirri]|uniref:Uncharacterized protein n=1 Tax=Fusarium gaditjirri TaxID=282569 RepID=A0A8H4WNQ6_9HYPO|nr:hypothetical protein FGADI_12196 [Fusarium gaditjirri]